MNFYHLLHRPVLVLPQYVCGNGRSRDRFAPLSLGRIDLQYSSTVQLIRITGGTVANLAETMDIDATIGRIMI